MTNAPELTPTPAALWRRMREQGHALQLPSGAVARVRNVPFDLFLRLGRIPNSLVSVVVAGMNGREMDLPTVETLDDALTNIDFLDALTRCALVFPRVVDVPQKDDEVAIEDVPLEDKLALVGLLGLPARELERFCGAQADALADLDPGAGEPLPPIFPPEPESMVTGAHGSAGG